MTNAQISRCIPEISTQNLTQLLSSVKSPLATDILSQWGASVLVGLTFSPNLSTNFELMIIRSDS